MSEHSPEATRLAECEFRSGRRRISLQETQRPQRSRAATNEKLLMMSLFHQNIGVPYPARGYMFIARSTLHLRRRSEEREASCVLRLARFPLLRTASGWRLNVSINMQLLTE